jgi:hypothetical protein
LRSCCLVLLLLASLFLSAGPIDRPIHQETKPANLQEG